MQGSSVSAWAPVVLLIVIGVLFAALEAAGVTIDDALLEQLIPTIPSSELFATALEYRLK